MHNPGYYVSTFCCSVHNKHIFLLYMFWPSLTGIVWYWQLLQSEIWKFTGFSRFPTYQSNITVLSAVLQGLCLSIHIDCCILIENSVCYSALQAFGTEKSQRLAFCFLLITWFIAMPRGFSFKRSVPTEAAHPADKSVS